MSLHDFLTGALDLLQVIEGIQQRQDEIEEHIRKTQALRPGDAMRSMLLLQLKKQLDAVDEDMVRALALIQKNSE